MTIDDIERLLLRLEGTDITDFEIEDATSRLKLRLAPGVRAGQASTPAPNDPEPAAPTHAIEARALGRLRLRHPDAAPEAEDPYPKTVVTGDIVAFLEAGALLRPVVADADGLIGPPLEQDGSLVGYGTPLFRFV